MPTCPTSCLHAAEPGREGLHDYCRSEQGANTLGQTWVKAPSCCKFCGSPCTCPCHQGGEVPRPPGQRVLQSRRPGVDGDYDWHDEAYLGESEDLAAPGALLDIYPGDREFRVVRRTEITEVTLGRP